MIMLGIALAVLVVLLGLVMLLIKDAAEINNWPEEHDE